MIDLTSCVIFKDSKIKETHGYFIYVMNFTLNISTMKSVEGK